MSPAATLDSIETRGVADSALSRFLRSRNVQWPPGAWDLEALTLVAFVYHPDLDAARSRWAESRAALITAGQRPNPDFSGVPGYNSTSSPITPWILTFDLIFSLETGGKRSRRIEQAERFSDAARFDLATTAWSVRSRVRRALLDAYGSSSLVAALTRLQAIHDQNIALLARQLEAGAISPFEATQARLNRDAARLALHDAQRRQAAAQVALASALGVTSRAIDTLALSFGVFERSAPQIPGPDLRRQALTNRADVLSALAAYEASQASLQLEIARQYPDLRIGPGYELDQGDNKWRLNLGLALPVLHRNRGPIAEAEARRATAAARFLQTQSRAIEEIDGALAAYRAALAKTATADSMFGDRQRQLRTADLQYSAGEISRLDLGVIQLELANAELATLDARLGVQETLGSLEDAIQSPIDLPQWLFDPTSRDRPRQPKR